VCVSFSGLIEEEEEPRKEAAEDGELICLIDERKLFIWLIKGFVYFLEGSDFIGWTQGEASKGA